MPGTEQQSTPSSLASLPTPQGTPSSRTAEVKQAQPDMSQLLAAFEKINARLERLESGPPQDAPGVADAVASVASYRGGRAGGASASAPGASATPTSRVSAKEQLRRRKVTPFPPTPRLDFRVPYDGRDSEDEAGGVDVKTEDCPGDGRLAEVLMANILANHRSALDYVRSIDFSNQRSAHEARRTAQAVDALLREGVSLQLEGMEILVRNLAGVVEADKLGEPAVLTGMEWQPPQDIVPRSVLRTVLKDAKRRKELKPKKAAKPTPAPRDPKKGGQQGAGKQ